jgi:hypothetical protein
MASVPGIKAYNRTDSLMAGKAFRLEASLSDLFLGTVETVELAFAESHISRKTSEIPGFPVRIASRGRVCGFH